MGAELGILSRTNPHEKLTSDGGPPGGTWMWNPKQSPEEDDDSWEVRAFAEDTGNVLGATWPPRSYTCTFCRREFRSAQALGGHMNVHRRDRARLHQPHQPSLAATGSHSGGPTTFIIPASSGLCFYQPPNPDEVFARTSASGFDHAPLAASSYAGRGTLLGHPVSFQATSSPVSSPRIYTGNIDAAFDSGKRNNGNGNKRKDLGHEELDLELRLGHRSRKPTL